MDEDIIKIFRELEYEIDVNRKMAANHQLAFEESIGNVAALKMLSDSNVEEAVKNS